MLNQSELNHIAQNFDNSGELLFKGSRNIIKVFDVNGKKINVKSFKRPNLFKKIIYKFFRESKAKRSFLNAEFLIQNGFKTPTPYGFIEKSDWLGITNSYYFCEHLENAFLLEKVVINENFPERKKILMDYTDYFFNLHQKGIEFIDNSLGNTLIVKNNNEYNFYLIDLNRLNDNKQLSIDDRMKNFARLTLNQTVWEAISEKYSELSQQHTVEELYEKLKKYSFDFYTGIARKRNLKKLRLFDLNNLDALNE